MTRLQTVGYVLARIAAPMLIIALGAGGLWVFGQKPPQEEKRPEEQPKTIVEVVDVEPFEGRFTIEVDGVALPLRQIETSAQVAGVVLKKAKQCIGGEYIEAGQLLVEIDPTDYELEVERFTAQLEQAEESLAEVSVAMTNTKALIELADKDLLLQTKNLNRIKGLFDRNATSESAVDDAERQELTSQNALQSLKNQLRTHQQQEKSLDAARKLAAAQLKRAATDLARTKVTAPASGTIISSEIEEGDYVHVGDPLFRTNDTDDMEVSCQLRVEELYWIWLQAGTFSSEGTASETFEIPNVPVEVVFEFRGVEYLWDGKLSRYEGTGLDHSTRTVPCRILVEEPTHVRTGGDGVAGPVAPPTLFSGMYVKVRIPVEPPLPLVKVPTAALQPGGDVWLVRNGALDIQQVRVARTTNDAALLPISKNGPQPGEKIVVSPLAGPSQGMEVHAINPNSPLERAAAESATTTTADEAAEDAPK